MIISSRPLVEIVPLEPAAWEGRVLCQWESRHMGVSVKIKNIFTILIFMPAKAGMWGVV
jgi:hypothetical protein